MSRPLHVDWQESEQTLHQHYREAIDHQDRTRLQALWLLRAGRSISEVAEIVGMCYESVRRWTVWYRSGGVEEVLSRRHGGSGGRKPRLSEAQHEKLRRKAERGELRTIWDGVQWAEEEADATYSYWGMRHIFERLELRKNVPRQQAPQADPEEQDAWKKGA